MNCFFKVADSIVQRILVMVGLLYVTQKDFPASHFQFYKNQSPIRVQKISNLHYPFSMINMLEHTWNLINNEILIYLAKRCQLDEGRHYADWTFSFKEN